MKKTIIFIALVTSFFGCGTSRPTTDLSITALDVYIDKEKIGTTPINFVLGPRENYKVSFQGSYLYARKKYEVKEKKRTPVVFKIVNSKPVYTNLRTGETISITD